MFSVLKSTQYQSRFLSYIFLFRLRKSYFKNIKYKKKKKKLDYYYYHYHLLVFLDFMAEIAYEMVPKVHLLPPI